MLRLNIYNSRLACGRVFSFLSIFVFSVVFLSGCTLELASHVGKKLSARHEKSVGTYKVGSPYTIKGRRYYPAVDYNYNKTGIASWYGPNFHGKKTANGEIFDQNELTAAHKTLPLPSIVRVTNLENGRSLIVRVNDRGPYAHSRIIDMSKRSAELLGFKKQGVAKVRVEVMEAESKKIANIAKSGRDTSGMEVPMNRRSYKPAIVKPSIAVAKVTYPILSLKPSVFVQMGSFSTREAAMKYASSLENYGRANIYKAIVNEKKYYRVRFPAKSTFEADSLLSRLALDGHNNALIVVD